jgi:hypothetical protein
LYLYQDDQPDAEFKMFFFAPKSSSIFSKIFILSDNISFQFISKNLVSEENLISDSRLSSKPLHKILNFNSKIFSSSVKFFGFTKSSHKKFILHSEKLSVQENFFSKTSLNSKTFLLYSKKICKPATHEKFFTFIIKLFSSKIFQEKFSQ